MNLAFAFEAILLERRGVDILDDVSTNATYYATPSKHQANGMYEDRSLEI